MWRKEEEEEGRKDASEGALGGKRKTNLYLKEILWRSVDLLKALLARFWHSLHLDGSYQWEDACLACLSMSRWYRFLFALTYVDDFSDLYVMSNKGDAVGGV